MRFLSVCSGIEAASVAWKPLGWQALAFSEIEPFPRAVLQHHYPEVPLHGDFTKLRDEQFIVDADLLVGGTPCQSFSIAGLRKSLSDDRGNLSLEFVRLANAIDDLRCAAGRKECFVLWENVPGVLSTKDNAFGSFLGGLVGSESPIVPDGRWSNAGVVAGPRRIAAWRVLDAQYFGVAQRRRRVFVLAHGHSRGWACADAILSVTDSLSGHPAPRREKGKSAPTIPSRSSAGGGLGTDFDCDGGLIEQAWPAEVAPTLNAAFGTKLGLEDQHIRGGADGSFLPQVAMCLNAGAMGRRDAETETLIPTTGAVFDVVQVAHSLRCEGFDASEDGTGRGTPLVPVAFDTTQITSAANYSNPKPGDACHPLAAGAHPPAIAFTAKDYGADAMDDCSPTLRAGGFSNSHANGGVMPAVAYAIQERAVSENLVNGPQGKGFQEGVAYTLEARNKVQAAAVAFALRGRDGGAMPEIEGDQVGALRAANGGSSRSYVAASAVRRLTPEECEKLQGFLPGYTLIPWRKKPVDQCPDGPRYKSLGNSMAVPVMSWLGQRIAAVEAIIKQEQEV